MNHGELTAKEALSMESVHEVKLEAHLNDLMEREGKVRATPSRGVVSSLPVMTHGNLGAVGGASWACTGNRAAALEGTRVLSRLMRGQQAPHI